MRIPVEALLSRLSRDIDTGAILRPLSTRHERPEDDLAGKQVPVVRLSMVLPCFTLGSRRFFSHDRQEPHALESTALIVGRPDLWTCIFRYCRKYELFLEVEKRGAKECRRFRLQAVDGRKSE